MQHRNDGLLLGVAILALGSGLLLLGVLLLPLVGPEEEAIPPQLPAGQAVSTPSLGPTPGRVALPDCGRRAAESPSAGDPQLQTIELAVTDLPEGRPAGIAYLPDARLLALAMEGEQGGELHRITLFGDRAGTVALQSTGAQPLAVLAGRQPARVAALADDNSYLALIPLGKDGTPVAGADVHHLDLRGFGLKGVTTASALPGEAGIVVLDSSAGRAVQISLSAPTPRSSHPRIGSACQVQLGGMPGEPVAAAVRPGDGRLLVLADRQGEAILHEMDGSGASLAEHQMPALDPGRVVAMTFAPSADPTDESSRQDLYLLEHGPGTVRVLAATFAIPNQQPDVPVLTPETVRVTETGIWDPPSTDPTGIAWDAERGQLLVTDSEIDESPHDAGRNAWLVNPDGGLGVALTLLRTDEPTDVAIDPETGRVFVSDDAEKRILLFEPGADGELATRDDTIGVIPLANTDVIDPEGLAFGQGSLFIADGLSREVYRLTPGPNGAWDAPAPAGDDEIFAFDAGALGFSDPEGITFDPVRGTLYLVDRSRRGPIAEISTDGRLLRLLDLDVVGVRSPAGLAIAPSSDDPARRSLYLVDRGVDNARDPAESDGRLFELRIEGL